MSLNNCSFSGRFVADPYYSDTNGVEKTTFTLAVDRDRKNEDGTRDADFPDFIAWRGTAKFIHDHFSKGELVTLSNTRMRSRNYKNEKGETVHKCEFEVMAKSDIYFGSRRGENTKADDQNPFDESGWTE